MKLSEFKQHLSTISEIYFLKPNGNPIPKHFHITEVGEINKRFIDCGGTVRSETIISMQLWESVDEWHRLLPNKLMEIIKISENKLSIGNHNIEVEYQGETIGKYEIEFKDGYFQLIAKQTACLAEDNCGIPTLKNNSASETSCCTPGGGCC